MVAQTDALGGTKKYSYDAMGRKLAETNELGKTTIAVKIVFAS